jgi:hypothetical protein
VFVLAGRGAMASGAVLWASAMASARSLGRAAALGCGGRAAARWRSGGSAMRWHGGGEGVDGGVNRLGDRSGGRGCSSGALPLSSICE